MPPLSNQYLAALAAAAQDERVVQITLTEAGWEMRQRAGHIPLAMLCQTGLELGELAALREQLKELTARIRA